MYHDVMSFLLWLVAGALVSFLGPLKRNSHLAPYSLSSHSFSASQLGYRAIRRNEYYLPTCHKHSQYNMPKEVPKPQSNTPRRRNAKKSKVVTKSTSNNEREGRKRQRIGNPQYSPIHNYEINDGGTDLDSDEESAVDAAAERLMRLRRDNEQETDSHDDDEDDDEEEDDDEVDLGTLLDGTLRRSERLAGRVTTSEEAINVEGVEIGENTVTVSDGWVFYSKNALKDESFYDTKCVYFGIMVTDDMLDMDIVINFKDFDPLDLDDATTKIGYTFTVGDSPQCLGERMKDVTATTIIGAFVKRIKFGVHTTLEGIRKVETAAKLLAFLHTIPSEDGLVQSRYLGAGELFNLSTDICDALLDVMVEYGRTGKFEFMVGSKRITEEAVDNMRNTNYKKYFYKSSRRHHLPGCPFHEKDKDIRSTTDWIRFKRDPIWECPCIQMFPGIKNIGNTCYVSALLQILSNVPGFLDDMQSIVEASSRTRRPSNMPLTRLLLSLLSIGSTQTTVADPTQFKECFDKMSGNEFGENEEHDPIEFLTRLLDLLGRESNELKSLIEQQFSVGVEITHTCKACERDSTPPQEQNFPLSIELPDDADDTAVLPVEDLISNHFEDEDVQLMCNSCGGEDATRSYKITKW